MLGRDVGAVFQDPMTSLNPLFTVESQLTETLRSHLKLGQGRRARRAPSNCSKSVGIPEPERRLKAYPHQLSGGQRQRVVIAAALSCDPKLVVADEPTTALDVSVQAQILKLLRDLADQRGIGILLVTHNMGVVAQIADRVTIMHRGKVVESGPTAEVLRRPKAAYAKALIGAVPRIDQRLDRFPVVGDEGQGPRGRCPRGAAREGRARRTRLPTEQPILSVENLLRRLHDQRLAPGLEGPSLPRGGRRQLLRPQRRGLRARGRIRLRQDHHRQCRVGPRETHRRARALSRAERCRRRRGPPRRAAAPGDPDDLPGSLFVAQQPHAHRLDPVRADPVLPPRRLDAPRRRATSPDSSRPSVSKRMPPSASRTHFRAASGSASPSRARSARVRKLIVCDEPTSSLDVSVQAQILNLLKDLRDATGLTLLLISHDLAVVRQMCDRVAVMRTGKLVEQADSETLFDAPQHPYTQELLSLVPTLDRIRGETQAA